MSSNKKDQHGAHRGAPSSAGEAQQRTIINRNQLRRSPGRRSPSHWEILVPSSVELSGRKTKASWNPRTDATVPTTTSTPTKAALNESLSTACSTNYDPIRLLYNDGEDEGNDCRFRPSPRFIVERPDGFDTSSSSSKYEENKNASHFIPGRETSLTARLSPERDLGSARNLFPYERHHSQEDNDFDDSDDDQVYVRMGSFPTSPNTCSGSRSSGKPSPSHRHSRQRTSRRSPSHQVLYDRSNSFGVSTVHETGRFGYGLSERRRSSRGVPILSRLIQRSSSSEELQTSSEGVIIRSGRSRRKHSRRASSRSMGHHRRDSSREANDQRSARVWKHILRQIHGRGLLWVLCLVGLTSVSMTIVTNRTIAQRAELEGRIAIHFPTNMVIDGTSHSFQPPNAGLRGKILHQLGHVHEWPASVTVELGEHYAAAVDEVDNTKNRNRGKKDSSRPKSVAKKQNEKKILTPEQPVSKPKDPKKPVTRQSAQSVAIPKSLLVKPGFDAIDRSLYQTSSRNKKSSGSSRQKVRPDSTKRVVFIHDSIKNVMKQRKIQLYPPPFTDNTQLYGVLDSDDERIKTMEIREPLEKGECVPMQDWQKTFYPSCNSMHEYNLAGLGQESGVDFDLFGTKGYWRNAWRVEAPGEHESQRDTVVLKTLKIEHRFEDAHYEHNRIDAVALERLTASPHVINIYGFCGQSVVTEYADGKRLGELADKSKKSPLSRLRIARDIANGLADVHGIDGDGNATFVHLDINPANVVSVGGTLKLNDFNIGILRRWNTTSNTPCGFPAQYPNPQWRSPEEARNEQNLTEKVDVFSMGHILFRLICGHEPWNKLEPGGKPSKAELNDNVMKGKLPTIPQDVLESVDPEIVAIREAMMQCYTYDPVKRPSARQIALSLQKTLTSLESERPFNAVDDP